MRTNAPAYSLLVSSLPLLLAAVLLQSACEPYENGPSLPDELLLLQGEGIDGRLYMLAPTAQSVISIDPQTREFEAIPVGRDPTVLARPKGGDVLYTLDRKDNALSQISAGGSVSSVDLGAPFTTLDWSPDGTRAIAWFHPDEADDLVVDGSLNLNAYAAIEIGEDEVSVSFGSLTFEPHAVIFSADSTKVLIATTARLHIVDLLADPISELAVPFTADDSIHRPPAIVAPGPFGEQALVTVSGIPDLFVLGLDPVMIENVAPLPRPAMSVVWSADGTRAIIADGTSQVTFLDLQTNAVEALHLDHSVNRIQMSRLPQNSFALLYDDRGWNTYITRVELDSSATAPDDPETYLLEDGIGRVELSPSEEAAVIFHSTNGFSSSVQADTLSLFHFAERAPSRIRLDAAAWDMIFLGSGVIPGSDDEHVIVVLKDSARLVRYNLRTYAQVVLETYPLPHAIGRIPAPAGGSELLFVVHDQDAGLVSFLSPDANSVPSGGFPAIAGMGLTGLLDRR
jgi:hypothetical protein